MTNLQNRVAFVSDADSKVGQAVARRLAQEDFHVILNSRGRNETSFVAADIEGQYGNKVMLTKFDLTKGASVHALLDSVLDTFGRLDVVVHTNQLVLNVPIESCSEAAFQQAIDENVTSAFLCTQILGRHLAAAGQGQVIFAGSIHSEKPNGSSFLFSISEGAIQMLSREAALELGRHGVRVNYIQFGPTQRDDERFASDISDLYVNYRRKVPSAELGSEADLANVVAFLVSSDARYVNGTEVRVDGGFLLHYMDHKMKP